MCYLINLMKKVKTKKLWLAIILVIILLALVFYRLHLTNEIKLAEQRAQQQDAELAKLKSIKRAPVSFDVEAAKFNTYYKTALIATRQGDAPKSEIALQSAITSWRDIANYYRSNQPVDYMKTKDWLAKINNIYELVIKAENFIPQKKLAEAHGNLVAIGQALSAMRQENDKKTIGDDLLSFYENVKAASDAPDKTEVMKKLPDLKLRFTILKEYNINAEYKKEIGNLEEIIGAIDRLEGPDWAKAHKALEPAFNQLFLRFG